MSTTGDVHRRGRWHALLVAVAVSAAPLTAACSRGSGHTPSTSASTAPAPRRGGILRVGAEAPRSLDPAQARSTSELVAAHLLFDALTTFDAGTAGVRGALADHWQATPDQRHWDFHLRAGARFSNGRAVAPADVKYTLERIARKGSGAPDLLVSALDPVTGFGAFNGTGAAAQLVGVTTPAADVVHLDLDQPVPDLPAVLANPGFGVVPREAVEAPSPTFAEQPVGSGPFAFASRDAGAIHLIRAPGSVAYLDGVDLTLGDPATSYRRFGDGGLDWSLVPADRVGEAAERFGRGGFVPYVAVLFYGFNLRRPVFADARFREAIVHAVDRRAIATAVYGDSVVPIDGPVPKGLPGFQPDACGPRCTHDPTKARALLAQAFPGGNVPPFAIDFEDDPTQQAVAKAIQTGLAAVGVTTTLRPHPVDAYPQVIGRGDQDLFRLGWVAIDPRADAFLGPLFRSGADTNVTGFAVPAIDDLLARARSTADEGQRLALYQDAERRIMDQVPIVPIAQFQTLSVIATRVHGLAVDALGTFDGARVWLSA